MTQTPTRLDANDADAGRATRMTDHIGKATTMIDLDALEKLADEAMLPMSVKTMRMHKKAVREFRIFANPWKIKALIAELKEARGHLARCVELVPEPGAIEAADAFLARNGKGEEKEIIHPRNGPKGLSDEC